MSGTPRPGKTLPDTIGPNRNGVDAWLKDNSGFYYTSYAATAAGQELKAATKFQKIYFHKLGTPQSEDKVVYERPENGDLFSGGRDQRGRPLAAHHRRQRHRADEHGLFQGPATKPATLSSAGRESRQRWNFLGNDGSTFYFETDKDAPHDKIVKVDVNGDKKWVDVVPRVKGHARRRQPDQQQPVRSQLSAGRPHASSRSTTRRANSFVTSNCPASARPADLAESATTRETFYTYSSYNAPPTIYRYDMKTGKSTLFRQAEGQIRRLAIRGQTGLLPSQRTARRSRCSSTYKKGIKLDGTNPTLLYGYGGFNIPSTPGFLGRPRCVARDGRRLCGRMYPRR